MLLLGAIVAVVVVGGAALATRSPRPQDSRPNQAREGGGPITATGGGGTAPAAEGKPLATSELRGPDNTTSDVIKGASTGLGVVGSVVGVVKGIVGGATAVAGAAGGTAAASGGTTAAAVGASLGPIALFVVAAAAVVAGVTLGIMNIVKDVNSQALGAFGYLQQQLVALAHGTSAKLQLQYQAAGMSNLKARSLANLVGFAVAVGYNRAALAYVVQGAAREQAGPIPIGSIDPQNDRHLMFYIARAMCLPDAPGFIYKSANPVPPKPPGFQGAWPPPSPLLDGRKWDLTLEEYVFAGSTRAQAIADAGDAWTPEIERACDFMGRAMRCAFHLHNEYGIEGGVLVGPTSQKVRGFARLGMIGMPPPSSKPGAHPPGAETPVFEEFSIKGGQCVHQLNGQGELGWFFNESYSGATGVRPYR